MVDSYQDHLPTQGQFPLFTRRYFFLSFPPTHHSIHTSGSSFARMEEKAMKCHSPFRQCNRVRRPHGPWNCPRRLPLSTPSASDILRSVIHVFQLHCFSFLFFRLFFSRAQRSRFSLLPRSNTLFFETHIPFYTIFTNSWRAHFLLLLFL